MESKKSVYILGLSFDYHDAAAALIKDGVVIAAAQEERFSRIKHDASLPKAALAYCLAHASITEADLNYVVYYEKPFTKFERLLKTYIASWPRGLLSFIRAMISFLGSKLWVEHRIRKALPSYDGAVLFVEHHYSHAASAYYASGFNDAAIITMDGVGEFDTTTIGYGNGAELVLTDTVEFPHSLGLFYSALTYYLGFKVNSAEYKVMGLAPYGNPETYYKKLKEVITIHNDGSITLNMKYFSYQYGLRMTNRHFDKLLGGKPRSPEAPLTEREKDIAAALQRITEEVVLALAQHVKQKFNKKNLCLAGGVALNCVANGKILEAKLFDQIYIQPASGDAGGAVGCALYTYYAALKHPYPTTNPVMGHAYLGPEYSDEIIEAVLTAHNVTYKKYSDETSLINAAARLIEGNNVIGWFQGRMEFGPRALGNRSIIADPRNKENWQKVNLKIKFRESFRPFAPSVLEERTSEYFALAVPSPYMLLVAPVRHPNIPAVTHVDTSARVQSVNKQDNPRYHALIENFERNTGCGVIINTSFNVRGEPIVESPEHALQGFLNTFMDYLVVGSFVVAKSDNMHLVNEQKMQAYLGQFQLD